MLLLKKCIVAGSDHTHFLTKSFFKQLYIIVPTNSFVRHFLPDILCDYHFEITLNTKTTMF